MYRRASGSPPAFRQSVLPDPRVPGREAILLWADLISLLFRRPVVHCTATSGRKRSSFGPGTCRLCLLTLVRNGLFGLSEEPDGIFGGTAVRERRQWSTPVGVAPDNQRRAGSFQGLTYGRRAAKVGVRDVRPIVHDQDVRIISGELADALAEITFGAPEWPARITDDPGQAVDSQTAAGYAVDIQEANVFLSFEGIEARNGRA